MTERDYSDVAAQPDSTGAPASTLQRIVVVGTPGAGKTTLAEILAQRLGHPFIELDALFWGPNWTAVGTELFRARVAQALAQPCWTVGGNYSVARDLIWGRADTLIWLDYALPLSMGRLLRRSLRRMITREELWAGNRESWRDLFFSRDSLIYFALKTHYSRRRAFTQALGRPEHAYLTVRQFRSPRQTDAWLATLG
jgi:adenylate kinase family enzyme